MKLETNGTVRVDRSQEHVAWVRFESGHRLNIIDEPVLAGLEAAIDELARDPSLRVLVLTGIPGMFSGGADLDAVGAMASAEFRAYVAREYRVFEAVERFPCVTIAAIGGTCIGNGAELALACDLRVAASGSRFGLPETKVAFMAPAQRITRYVGIGVARELCYSGRLIDADEARALGIYNRVFDGDFESQAAGFAGEYAAMAPLALRLTKQNFLAAMERPMANANGEVLQSVVSFESADFREGVAAIKERRAPRFEGR